MSSLDFDLDMKMNCLEREWRQACESSIVARSDYQILAASAKVNDNLLDMARHRVERLEAQKAKILAKMERMEDDMLGRD
jgi:hypothetical protein